MTLISVDLQFDVSIWLVDCPSRCYKLWILKGGHYTKLFYICLVYVKYTKKKRVNLRPSH